MAHGSFGTLLLPVTVLSQEMASAAMAALKIEEYAPEILSAVTDWWLGSYVGCYMAFVWAA
jgi:hypothetical protein